MSTFVRKKICEKINGFFKCNRIYYELEVPSKKQYLSENKFVLHWTPSKENSAQLQSSLKALKDFQYDTELVENVHLLSAQGKEAAKVEFVLRKDAYIKTLLCEEQNLVYEFPNKHMVFEFSSPNIAKPFHVGHLRSTIIGNVLANLHEELGYKITRMNYLGDWGTQLGMLQVGVEMLDVTQREIQLAPIETLYKAYVKANEASIIDPNITERARQIFSQLEGENCESSLSKQWHLYRDYTIKELQIAYERLGIKFDMYEWESQYSQKQILEILRMLEAKHLLLPEKDGRKVVEVEDRRVPVVKSDGSTLYLTRDIAALIDRWKRFQFSEILYVVENGQSDHFKALFKTTSRLLDEIKENRLRHIKFGRIHGMSTRKGQAVFLKDLLDEARERMFEKQTQSPNTKASLNNKEIADVLGVTAVIINDLKQRRQRDYEFSWDKALQMNGDTGIKLQYTHCRLYSLLEQNAHLIQDNVVEPRFDYLNEEEAIDLLHILGRYPQVLWQTKEKLEACILVNYLFNLCNSTSLCLKRLPVKTEENILKQKQRLLLFQAAKRTLQRGMNILGLKCLNVM
uniref:Probable arginine--tRNA ligase, mitochondrial n=1 Tax=Glossina palpalis gambiensis TaxID=67801 RepID=A0A1B0BY84_9MUSC